ncbi:CTP synthase, partial [Bienertia sinuspersici]
EFNISDGKLRCPGIKCANNKLLSLNDVNYHLLHFGIMHNYNNWNFYGENMDEISSKPMVENETIGETNLHQFVHDTYDVNIMQDKCPSDAEKDQWISLVTFWRSEEGKVIL